MRRRLAESLVADVGVPLGGGDVGVAEQLLHQRGGPRHRRAGAWRSCGAARAGASASATAGRRCAGRRAASAGCPRSLPNSAEPAAGGTTSDRIASHARSASTADIAQRDTALLRALAPDGHGSTVEVERLEVEPAELADADATAVQQLEHRIVAAAAPHRLVVRRRGHRAASPISPASSTAADAPPLPVRAATRSDRPRSRRSGAASGSTAAAQPPSGRCCASRTAGW